MKGAAILTSLTNTAKHLLDNLAESLAVDAEPHVWQTLDHGKTCWHAYDPTTGDGADFGSEDDVRVWLEQRYYSHN